MANLNSRCILYTYFMVILLSSLVVNAKVCEVTRTRYVGPREHICPDSVCKSGERLANYDCVGNEYESGFCVHNLDYGRSMKCIIRCHYSAILWC